MKITVRLVSALLAGAADCELGILRREGVSGIGCKQRGNRHGIVRGQHDHRSFPERCQWLY